MTDAQNEARALAQRLSIHHSDADRIAIIAAALAARDAEIERSEKHRNDLHDSIVSLRTELAAVRRRAKRAEAQLAEANKALTAAYDFIDRVSGAALGLAMSGRDHPNPDGVLTEFSREGMELSNSARAARRAREAQGGE